MVNLKAKFKSDMLVNDAMKFIILLGIVSLLADMTYEGARSITGPYLAILGASATLVGFERVLVSSWVTPYVSSRGTLQIKADNIGQ
jgi:hypothetical protein